jgi:signal transduction histidine kinase/CheY-like chemotaxis protein
VSLRIARHAALPGAGGHGAAALDAAAAPAGAGITDDGAIAAQVLEAEVQRLSRNALPAALFAWATAAACSLLLLPGSSWAPATGLALWSLLVHGTALAWVAVLLAHRRAGKTRPLAWRARCRAALLAHALAWGLLPGWLALGSWQVVSLLAIAVAALAAVGAAALNADRLSLQLWLAPLGLPLVAALGAQASGPAWALALFLAAFIGVLLHFALVHNRVVGNALRADFDNVALVQRLHQQMELAAEASRDKSRFLAAASHDLRQPLHALSFFGAALENRMADSSDHPLIYNMMRSIEALDKSFGAILDISRLDARAVEPNITTFPLRDLFRRLQMNFAGLAEEAGLQLRFKPGGKVVRSDAQLLERVLGNLIQNGIRYCRQGGLTVVARSWRGGVNIEVWDTGIGIADSELPRIFGEFYQVANPERDRSKGLGMGLAIVKRLTLLLNHTLTVHSRPGRGSLFRLWIEGSELDHLEEFTVGAETVPGCIDDSRTLLFIDDEEDIRLSVQHLLTQWGYEVLAASTIEEAQALAMQRQGLIDIVMSDLRLRGTDDGLRAIERVRQVCGYDVPALLVTGDTSPEQVKRVHESGLIVLFKPVQPKELFAVLQRLSD